MAHFGLICPVETGHLHTMLPLGKELKRRGHQVTFFGIVDAEAKIKAAGLEFQGIGEKVFPLGSTEQGFAELAKLRGIPALLYTMNWFRGLADTFLQEAPTIIKSANIDTLLVDQISPEGGTIAEFLKISFITVCSALPFNQESGIPPFFTTWQYDSVWWARLRNQIIYALANPFGKSLKQLRAKYRQKWNLPPESSVDSSLAILCHQPAPFEFPREKLPQWFHFTGPYHTSMERPMIPFPWEKLTGQPLIYASMGTLQNGMIDVFEKIAQACVGLEAQLVISLGGKNKFESLPKLPGNPLVVEYAAQLELLQKAVLNITHAGMNSTLESLTYGVPMVAIPITNDQPGIAARIAWTGTGELIPLSQLTVSKLRATIQKVLTEDSYRNNALRLQKAIHQAGGVQRAVDIIETVALTKQPVLKTKF
ncbi:glycosyltransferase [Crocosphaera sp. UHCC 0190]|uniref:glycosyltransferase n=1 Tax=Crocosphaera sp. UHCC 0190 TaxID=3110246 RepID=UPI002B1F5E03|nr:glycosyltransferase [Crocosphaera sp. UHCC 0190]MEA5509470.1 glycosyltransferase [Crocosphaera sp. UHCC 0190]